MKRSIIFLAVIAIAVSVFAQTARFNVATYNLRQLNKGDDEAGNGWAVRAPHVASLIRYHDFDIFGTQEGFKSQLEDLKALLPGYDYIGVGRDDGADGGEYAAIFYDTRRFTLLDKGNFWLSETPDRPGLGWDAVCVRICSWGRFRDNDSGKEFLFFNLHMDHRGKKARVESARLVKQRLCELGTELPVFLTGDFNVDQTSPSYATIIEGGLLEDSHDKADFVYEETGTFNNYSTSKYTTSRIDHIFVSPKVKVSKYGILTDTYRTPVAEAKAETADTAPEEVKLKKYKARIPSDHFPVAIAVEF